MIEVFYEAVVWKYPNLIGREEDTLEEVVFFLSRVFIVLIAQDLTRAAGALCSMVPIGYVKQWNFGKSIDQLMVMLYRNAPEGVLNSISSDEVKEWRSWLRG